VAFVTVGEPGSRQFYEQRTSGNQTSYMNRHEAEALLDGLQSVLSGGDVRCKDIGGWNLDDPWRRNMVMMTERVNIRHGGIITASFHLVLYTS
jgi:hypothetical protein